MKTKKTGRVIGIVGGVGPYAGVDLNKKILDNTVALSDQEHLETYLLSCSNKISDRTAFLKKVKDVENPADAIFEVIRKLRRIGATVIGIPCNTSHSRLIFNRIKSKIKKAGLDVDLLHMIEETRKYIKNELTGITKIGLLATIGAYDSGVYQNTFNKKNDPELIIPDKKHKWMVHNAIYDRTYGIKAYSNPVTAKAVEDLKHVIGLLKRQGAQAVIMGCTEIPLAITKKETDLVLVDPGTVLARALIRKADKIKLRPR